MRRPAGVSAKEPKANRSLNDTTNLWNVRTPGALAAAPNLHFAASKGLPSRRSRRGVSAAECAAHLRQCNIGTKGFADPGSLVRE